MLIKCFKNFDSLVRNNTFPFNKQTQGKEKVKYLRVTQCKEME